MDDADRIEAAIRQGLDGLIGITDMDEAVANIAAALSAPPIEQSGLADDCTICGQPKHKHHLDTGVYYCPAARFSYRPALRSNARAYEQGVEDAAKAAEKLTICMEWFEGHERSVRHPSPLETAQAIRQLKEAGQ